MFFDALKVLCSKLGEKDPVKHRDTKNHAAVKLWSREIYDIMIKADNENKLPEIVVSSKSLQKIPIANLSGANQVVPLSTRMDMMEKKMGELFDSVTKFVSGNAKVNLPVVGEVATVQGQVSGGPSGQGSGSMSFAGAVASNASGTHGTRQNQPLGFGNSLNVPSFQPRDRSLSVTSNSSKRKEIDGEGFEKVIHRKPRKVNYGNSSVMIEGGEAAPIDIFIGNTNPGSTPEIISDVLVKCAEMSEDITEALVVSEVKCLTKDENPRTKCWKVTVPNKFREYMDKDSAFPRGWSHRKFFQARNNKNKVVPLNPLEGVEQVNKKAKLGEGHSSSA